jgi:hypothetical protein
MKIKIFTWYDESLAEADLEEFFKNNKVIVEGIKLSRSDKALTVLIPYLPLDVTPSASTSNPYLDPHYNPNAHLR